MLGVRTTSRRDADVPPNLETLTDAVLRRRAVRFRYYGIGRDEESQREVEPYGLGWHDGHWYLVAQDRSRAELRHFRVDRIRGRARIVTGPAFKIPDDFRVDDHVDRPSFMLRAGRQSERVAVELKPDIAFMVKDALREGWAFRDLPEGGGVLEFDATDRAAVLRFVARHCERARVVAPADLSAEARSLFADILAAHEGPPSLPAPGSRSRRAGGAKR